MSDAQTQINSATSSFRGIIDRLIVCIDQETQSVRDDAGFDFQASVERKSRLLFELNRASRSINLDDLDSQCIGQLALLKNALQENENQIKAHLSAVREVSGIMVQLIKNEEADGTYCEFA